MSGNLSSSCRFWRVPCKRKGAFTTLSTVHVALAVTSLSRCVCVSTQLSKCTTLYAQTNAIINQLFVPDYLPFKSLISTHTQTLLFYKKKAYNPVNYVSNVLYVCFHQLYLPNVELVMQNTMSHILFLWFCIHGSVFVLKWNTICWHLYLFTCINDTLSENFIINQYFLYKHSSWWFMHRCMPVKNSVFIL